MSTTVADVMALLARGEPAFLERFSVPVLVVAKGLGNKPERKQGDTTQTLKVDKRAAAFVAAASLVLELEQTGRHRFPVVSVGRGPTNDVILDVHGVSKVHVTFARDASGGWSITDAGSTNGTLVGTVALKARESRVLQDGDEIVLGNSVTALFFQPRGLLGWAKLNRALFKL